MTIFRWQDYPKRKSPSRDTKGRYTKDRRHVIMKAQILRKRLGLPDDPRLGGV